MSRGELPTLLTLGQAAEALGGNIPASTLRAEVHAGRLACVRARPGCNAPILLTEKSILRWLEEHAGKRQLALSPVQAHDVREQLEELCGTARTEEQSSLPRRRNRGGVHAQD